MRSRLLTLALMCLAAPARGEVIERIVAVVDGRPLMLSEVRLVERLRGLDEATAREALIDERLMFGEAARLPQASVSAADEERAYGALVARVDPAPDAAGEALLRAVVRRQVAILKYVEFRFRPQLRVSEEAVRAAYAAESAGTSEPPPFAERGPLLRERLERRELDLRIETWIRELRAAAQIRYNP
jgi:hypothetical protein